MTEAPTIEALIKRLLAIIPELMELNRGVVGQSFEFRVIGERTAVAETA